MSAPAPAGPFTLTVIPGPVWHTTQSPAEGANTWTTTSV